MQELLQPNRLKQIRLRLGLTQQEFADMLGITQGNVGHYELRGQTMPPEGAMRLIAEAAVRGHRVTYEDIYGEVDTPVARKKQAPRVRREILELNERKERHAED
jgi:putative transcriptional regulator